ncbi:amino acid adenylation domain-containing protein [Nostoc sp. FACHB-87]|uniref:non-ribosomal peptide synthetase n=1 Tax=Nostocaceae TaxID=1162 RepID=UPI0016866174|nr:MULTISPECIES: non-ribosomal peptide synthetase [Nostocaceae]MBD2453057.1 amino acid adenylation domain-containing protein [Nostoc sp. FACHB-87]MBD2475165.1 amino acid adenylation domain-containing protein [Anabaena sp. FACHB-83]
MNQYSSSFQPSDVFSATSDTNDEFSLSNCRTVVELLGWRSSTQGNQDIFTFLLDGETEQARLTYQELDRLARRTAAQLQAMGLVGERALLLYPAGLDFLIAFFGCLYAGVVAVTAYPPRNQRNTPRIQAIAQDAQAAIALTTTDILPTVQSLISQRTDLGSLQWLTTDNIAPGIEDNWQKPHIDQDSLAFLQYTSGSTGTPKGVMISHRNLLHNAQTTRQFMEHSPASKFVTWLPMYHDMGLIGGILQPLYGGFPCIIMPPAAFLQRPYRWLQAISHYRGTTSGGPNFAYDLCVQKITPEQKATLDLSSWSVAFNGAEPIRYDTLERFAEAFAECGFRKEAFYPCYGMAETTLMVAGVQKAAPPKIKALQKSALASHQVVESSVVGGDDTSYFVSCGQIIPDQKVVITNPDTLKTCQPDEIGEIWVSGLSVGQGYWHRPAETAETFGAYLADTGEGPFLRTGDLGFLQDGELFITGRAKDLIIIRGRNLYPQDIELTAERSHSSLRPGANAAFTVLVNNEEKLVVVQELEFRAKPNLETVINAIRQAVTEEHEIQVYAVVLIKPGTICKTSSGKIQRRATRAQFENGELNIVANNILKASDIVQESIQLQRSQLLTLATQERQTVLEQYLIVQIANVLAITPDNIPLQAPLSTLGLDSLKVFELKNRVEVDIEVEISIADLFAGMSPRSLATKILTQITTAAFIPAVPLNPIPQAEVYPLSFAQQRLWFLDRLQPGNPAYNISLAVNLQGELDIILLEQSLNEIVRRHEALRTTLTVVNGQPVQIITPSLKLFLSVIDDQKNIASSVQQFLTEQSQQPFDLTKGPLLRAELLRLAPQEHILLLEMHHIISDGWSSEVFLQEIASLYKAFLTGTASSLPEISIQYKDFAHWQRQWLQGEILQTQLSYWKKQLQDIPAALQLPTDRPRPTVQTSNGAQQSLELSEVLINRLKAIAHQKGVTLYMLLLAAFQTFLYRYTGQDDIAVGSPIANRNRDEIKGLIGFFVNTLVLRTDLSGNPTFDELLKRVKKVALEAYTHQDLPFDQLVEAVQPERDTSRTPLFQVMFNIQDYSNLPEMPGLAVSWVKIDTKTAQFDLSLSIDITHQAVAASFHYNTDLFDAATIAKMLRHFENLLSGIGAEPQTRLSNLPLLSEADRQELLEFSTNKSQISNYQPQQCIHQQFAAQVERTPDAIAVIFENQSLTYRELNQRSNQLANYLKTLGVRAEVLVGICIERSLEMVVGLLAILKAGGAYLPLDPAYPQERLALMLKDAQVSVLLTTSTQAEKLPEHQAQVICLDTDWEVISRESQENPIHQTQPENLAYVIYTSGSTGTPKGVMIQHHALSNYINIACIELGIKASDRILQFASISFDTAAEEIFPCLVCGASLILRTEEMLSSIPQFLQQCRDYRVTVLDLPTAFWHQVTAELATANLAIPDSLRLVIIGGEKANRKHLTTWQQTIGQKVRLLNSYGPTETTIVATLCDLSVPTLGEVPIGKAIPQVQTYILDSNLQLVPVGTPGELYIGGVGVARGYLKRPDLTAEKFIPNPYNSKPGERLYKTGDLVRYLPDGNLEFLGRIDHQVKIRGFRIELGEIETLLNQHPGVREAVVVAHCDRSDHQRLIAYVVGQYHPEKVEALDTQQTLQWQTVFDSLYKKFDTSQNSGFYIKGWESSYTGASIPDEQVHEWMKQTTGRILGLQPNRVLEIGCGGSGLMLFSISPHCQQYWATDPSQNALQILQQQLDTLEQPLAGVTLSQRSALDFDDVAENSFDGVLIVSVAQYFPSIDYLLQVLEKAVKAVEPGGFIFLGDVRSLPLLEAFHASVQLYRSPDNLSKEALQQRVQKQLFEEKQLVIDPAFFIALKQHLPKISHVDILLERGCSHNELTKFRYDVILHVDDQPTSTAEISWLDWHKQELTLSSVRCILEETAPQFLGITGVPNARTIADVQLVQWLANSEKPETVGEIKQLFRYLEDRGVEPEDFWALEKDLPYSVQITWSNTGAGDRYDVIFKRSTPDAAECLCLPAAVPPSSRPWHNYANTPWQGNLARERVPQLRDFLKEKLPEYMVPSAFIFLDALPLTPNGKVNRRVLPLPESYATQNNLYVAPETELQQTIADTWQTVLGIEKVSINDNFFDLGGHSLLISQVNAQLREKLQRDISVVEMFQYPSISLLAKHLSQEQQEQQSFQEIRNRSEKQKSALNRKKQTRNLRK